MGDTITANNTTLKEDSSTVEKQVDHRLASAAATTHLHSSPRPAKNGNTTVSNLDGSYDTGMMMTPHGINSLTPIKEMPNKRRKLSNDESDEISSKGAAPFTSAIQSPALR